MGLFLFFCVKVYIVMYFLVSIRFYIRYFYDFPLSLYVHEKSFFYEKVSKYHFLAERKDK